MDYKSTLSLIRLITGLVEGFLPSQNSNESAACSTNIPNPSLIMRAESFKAHFMTKSAYGRDPIETHDRPLIYNLQADPSERFDLGESRPELVTAFENLRVHYFNEVEVAPSRLESRLPNQ